MFSKPTVLFLCLFSLAASAAEICPPVKEINNRDVGGLSRYVSENRFKSIECFLASLPEDVRSLRSYVKKSLSLQEASTENPRAIIGSPDGGFFLAFNGHKSQKGFNEVEFLALDKNSGPQKWVAGVIENVGGHLKMNTDIKKCSLCHGDPVRPIWGIYPEWPNLFGSVDDWLPDEKDLSKNSKYFEEDKKSESYGEGTGARMTEDKIKIAIDESRKFRSFRKTAVTHPRYLYLEKASDSESPVFPYTDVYRNRNGAFRPNLTIGSLMTIRQNQILARKVKNDSFYKHFKNSIFHYFKCFQDEKRKEHNFKLAALFDEYYEKQFFKKMRREDKGSFSFDVMKLLGLFPHESTLLFASNTDFLSQNDEEYFSGLFSISSNVISTLLQEYLSTWSEKDWLVYSNISNDYFFNEKFSYFKSKFLGKQITDLFGNASTRLVYILSEKGSTEEEYSARIMCDSLVQLSLEEIKIRAKYSSPVIEAGLHKELWPRPLQTCVKCHEGKDRVASYIPFSSPRELAKFNQIYRSPLGYGDFYDMVQFVVSSSSQPAHLGGQRMPLGHPPLTESEVELINSWLINAIKAK